METMEMSRTQVRAYQIWAVLTYAASKSQIITYKELDNATGLVAGGMSDALDMLQKYCKSQKLPPITALVVQEDNRKPGNWSVKDMKKWPDALRKIHTRKWNRKDAPKLDALK